MVNGQAMNSQDSLRLELKKSHHSPFYSIFYNSPWGLHVVIIIFFPKTPKFKILTFDFLEDYKGENTLGVNHFGKQK